MRGHHVPAAQQGGIPVAHFQLQLRQVAEQDGMIGREGMAANRPKSHLALHDPHPADQGLHFEQILP